MRAALALVTAGAVAVAVAAPADGAASPTRPGDRVAFQALERAGADLAVEQGWKYVGWDDDWSIRGALRTVGLVFDTGDGVTIGIEAEALVCGQRAVVVTLFDALASGVTTPRCAPAPRARYVDRARPRRRPTITKRR